MKKNILILLGHPNTETLSGHFADVYEEAARAAGHDVRRVNLGELQFDPILHKGYREIQALEPDLVKLQEDMKWCNHMLFIYPLWWLSMPALLKGLIDRIWLPGFAFRYHKSKSGKRQLGWDRLLKGRSARVVTLLNAPPFLEYIAFGDYMNELVHGTLGFAGFKTRVTKIGNSESLSPAMVARWEKKLKELGTKGI